MKILSTILFVALLATNLFAQKVLVLYDDAGPYGKMGKTNAILLQNLLGHFDVDIVSKPAKEYRSDEMKDAIATFYIGSTYDAPAYYAAGSVESTAYQAFFKDTATLGKTVVWMNYNLWRLDEAWKANNWGGMSMSEKFGLEFRYGNGIPYNRVEYKKTELYKGVVPFATPGAAVETCYAEGDNRYACALEMAMIAISDPLKAKAYATAYSTLYPERAADPYITKGENFWFVGDIPFTYMSEEDRYLAFSDLLHDMLGIHHKESHKALMRLEDVDARTDIGNLTDIAALAKNKKVVFTVAAIAKYVDPFGIENNGVPTTIKLSDSEIGKILKKLYKDKQITVVAHGYTHQYGNLSNPYNGLSGDDFEFMRVVDNGPDQAYSYLYPTMDDSGLGAYARMKSAKKILDKLKIKAFGWEAPHYMAGPNHYRAIKELYPVQYARVLYYPNEDSSDMSLKYNFIGQFYPYVIQSDMYGSTVIPENIHNIEDAPNPGYRPLMPADTIRFAKKLKVVRDGVASFYYHPYLGTALLAEIIDGIKAEGYEFVAAPTLIK